MWRCSSSRDEGLALGIVKLLAVIAVALSAVLGPSALVAQERARILEPPASTVPVQLTQRFRVGSLEGDDDAFGRIGFVALKSDGSLIVADDQLHRLTVFDARGRFVQHVGRQGQGPG